jgi:hypothetical protein
VEKRRKKHERQGERRGKKINTWMGGQGEERKKERRAEQKVSV